MELPRQIVVGEKNIGQVGEFLRSLSNPKKVSIISGKNVKKIIGKEIDESLKNAKIMAVWNLAKSNQVKETATKHFKGEKDLVLVSCDADNLKPDLKWEISRGGDLFPHLYRHLFFEDITSQIEIPKIKGIHKFPDTF